MTDEELKALVRSIADPDIEDPIFSDMVTLNFDEVRRLLGVEREAIAQEFDRRAVYADGTSSSGWYEPHEPAEIVRTRGRA